MWYEEHANVLVTDHCRRTCPLACRRSCAFSKTQKPGSFRGPRPLKHTGFAQGEFTRLRESGHRQRRIEEDQGFTQERLNSGPGVRSNPLAPERSPHGAACFS